MLLLRPLSILFGLVTSILGTIAQDITPLPNFGNNGIAYVQSVGTVPDVIITDMVTQVDGKVLMVGTYDAGGSGRLFAQRFDANGSLDQGFASAGRFFSPDDLGSIGCRAGAVGTDGRILLIGGRYVQGITNLVVLQIDATGALDGDFGQGGIAEFASSEDLVACDVDIALDGSAYITGGIGSSAFITRILSNGVLDTEFGTEGLALLTPDTFPALATELDLAPEGYMVAVGHKLDNPTSGSFLAAVDMAGNPITWFGDNGFREIDLQNTGAEHFSNLELLPNGSILTTGMRYYTSAWHEVFASFNPNGNSNTTFGINGLTEIECPQQVFREASVPRLLPDGDLLLSSAQTGSSGLDCKLRFIRLNANGSFENDFGTNGIVLYQRNGVVFNSSRWSSFLPSGDLVIGGQVSHFDASEHAVIAFQLNDLSTDLGYAAAGSRPTIVFPNPTGGTITLRNWELDPHQPIALLDEQGRTVQQWAPPATGGGLDLNIQLAPALANGRYIIMARATEGFHQAVLELAR